jgi:predicted RNA-binding Zn-ribbon protein involved in translation (DUF1610 family)
VEARIKQGLYWAQADRNYRATKAEHDAGKYRCPKCGHEHLRKAIYKMDGGARHRLYVCPNCTFVVKQDNIHTEHLEPRLAEKSRGEREAELLRRFPADCRSGRGKEAKLLLTGDVAKAFGVGDYSAVKVADLSDDQIEKLYQVVGG